MRIALDKLMETLGVGRTLSAYETQPWLFYDADRGITCSAEVRMGPGGEDIEVEIQFLHDEKEDDEGTDGEEGSSGGSREQIMHMRALPAHETLWSPVSLRVKDKDYANEVYNWEEKGCNFFRACVEALQMSELPDIDELIEKELSEDGGFGGGRRGKVGKKSPTIKPGQLLGMKKGM